MEKSESRMKFYKGTHIVKREVIDGNVIEIYVSFKDGVIFLQTYINFVFNCETVIADLGKVNNNDISG